MNRGLRFSRWWILLLVLGIFALGSYFALSRKCLSGRCAAQNISQLTPSPTAIPAAIFLPNVLDTETTPVVTKTPEIIEKFDPLRDADDALPQVKLVVPFTTQAPHGKWTATYEEACEEASLLMVGKYLSGGVFSPALADSEILQMIRWEQKNGYSVDVTAAELAKIAEQYLDRQARVYESGDVSVENIKKLLTAGYPVIIPAAGRMLGNPNYSNLGPPYHMLVIVGYDEQGFFTNDPGTRKGDGYYYRSSVLMDAIHDWTGSVGTIQTGERAMLVVGR